MVELESKETHIEEEVEVAAESSTPLIDNTLKAAKELKDQLDRQEKQLERKEQLMSKELLGGSSEAGNEPEKKKEETNEEYVDKLRKNGWKADG